MEEGDECAHDYYLKFYEKYQAMEEEKIQLEARLKQEETLKSMRMSLAVKMTPMSIFYHTKYCPPRLSTRSYPRPSPNCRSWVRKPMNAMESYSSESNGTLWWRRNLIRSSRGCFNCLFIVNISPY